MDSWFMKQPKSCERVSDIGANCSTDERYSPALKRKECEKILDFLLPVLPINS
jgi:hypothetical protein